MIYQYILNYNIEIINKLFQQIRLSDEILFQNHNLIHTPYIYKD
jgi:predicted metallopeptidase